MEIYWCLSAGDKVTFLSFLFICNMLRILLLILSRNQQFYLNVIIHSHPRQPAGHACFAQARLILSFGVVCYKEVTFALRDCESSWCHSGLHILTSPCLSRPMCLPWERAWNFNRNSSFFIKKMHLKMFANCRPLCLGLNMIMMTSLNGNIFRVTSPLCGKLSGHRLIHWSRVNSPHKDKWHGALVFSLICAWWMNGWVNNR